MPQDENWGSLLAKWRRESGEWDVAKPSWVVPESGARRSSEPRPGCLACSGIAQACIGEVCGYFSASLVTDYTVWVTMADSWGGQEH